MATLFCQKCATEVTPAMRKCPTCGAKITLPKNADHEVADARFDDANRFKNGGEAHKQDYTPPAFGEPKVKKSRELSGELPKEVQEKLAKFGLVNDEDFILAGVSLFIPIAGFIIAASVKQKRPELAKTASVLALISIGFALLSGI